MEQYHWLFTKTPDKDFSRVKKWSFGEVVKFILSTESSAIRDELLKYFDYNLNTPSNSSFNQRRSQILPEAFEYLFYEFNQRFAMLHLFRGLHLNALYNLCSRRYINAVIQPGRKKNECQAMAKMINQYRGDSNTLFIADRVYESYNVFAHVQERGMFYLIRACDSNNNCIISGLKQLPQTEEYDVIVPLKLTRIQTKEIKQHPEIYKFIASSTPLDYMDNKNKYDYQLNYTQAIKICLYFIRIKKKKAPPDVEELIQQELGEPTLAKSSPNPQ